MHPLAGSELLSLWERGARRHALDRSALLAAAARPDWDAASIVDRPLGAVNASLLQLRSASFGPHIAGHADCAQCGQRLAFTLDARQLLALADADTRPSSTDAAGLRLRAPSLRDLAAVAHEADAERATRTLLARCTLAGDAAQIDTAALREAEQALDALDPQADLAIALHCVACGHAGAAQLDPGALLWDDIETQAQRLLEQVHRLASAYGWSEDQILALSPARRASYLALQGARP